MEDKVRKAKELFLRLEDNRDGMIIKARRLFYIQEFLSKMSKREEN